MENKRKYSRIPMSLYGYIRHRNTMEAFRVDIVDISLHGVLVKSRCEMPQIALGEVMVLDVALDPRAPITATMICRHLRDKFLGFEIIDIDVESMTHLKRLVELNLGESKILNRELNELLNSNNY